MFTESILKSSLYLKPCCRVAYVKISVTVSGDWPCFIWNISIARLWVFLWWTWVWSIFFQEFFIRWQFVIINKLQTLFMYMLYFVVILTVSKSMSSNWIVHQKRIHYSLFIFLFSRYMQGAAWTNARNILLAFYIDFEPDRFYRSNIKKQIT